MSDAIRSQVSAFLQSIGVAYSATYTGEQTQNGWKCDGWRVTLKRNGTPEKPVARGTHPALSTDYYTGMAHRAKLNVPTSYPAALRAKHCGGKPVTPDAAGVLYSLVIDAEALDMSFVDWCGTFGGDSDSIRARNTYDACCAIGQQLRQLFTRDEVAQLRDMLQDY